MTDATEAFCCEQITAGRGHFRRFIPFSCPQIAHSCSWALQLGTSCQPDSELVESFEGAGLEEWLKVETIIPQASGSRGRGARLSRAQVLSRRSPRCFLADVCAWKNALRTRTHARTHTGARGQARAACVFQMDQGLFSRKLWSPLDIQHVCSSARSLRSRLACVCVLDGSSACSIAEDAMMKVRALVAGTIGCENSVRGSFFFSLLLQALCLRPCSRLSSPARR